MTIVNNTLSFDDIIQEYLKREAVFSVSELTALRKDAKWQADCCRCNVCGEILLHEDEAYVCIITNDVLCDKHSVYCELLDGVITSKLPTVNSPWDYIFKFIKYLTLKSNDDFIEYLEGNVLLPIFERSLVFCDKLSVTTIINDYLNELNDEGN